MLRAGGEVPGVNPKDSSKEPVLYLIPAAVGKFLLHQFPVLAVLVNKSHQKQVLLQGPLFRGQIGPEVVLVVVLELLVVAGCVRGAVHGNSRAIYFQCYRPS